MPCLCGFLLPGKRKALNTLGGIGCLLFIRVYGGPMGKERKEINQMFDKMFWELKKMGILLYHGAELDIIDLKRKESSINDREKFRGR